MGVGQVEIVAVIAHHVHPVVGAVEIQTCATLKNPISHHSIFLLKER